MCVPLYLTFLVGGGLVVAPGMTHVGLHLCGRPNQLTAWSCTRIEYTSGSHL